MRVLAGDIGGTSTRLCIADCKDGACRRLHTQRFSSSANASLAEILQEFLQQDAAMTFDGVCLAIAGPVRTTAAGQSAKVTSLPWEIESGALAQTFAPPYIRLINDFEATGHPTMRSVEPGDTWAWCYPDQAYLESVELRT